MKIKDVMIDVIRKEDSDVYPFIFAQFIQHMAAVLVFAAARTAKTDIPEARIGDDIIGGGKGKKRVDEIDIINILTGRDMMRQIPVSTQLSRFLEWFVECETDDCDEYMWFDFEYIVQKWDEFVEKQYNK